MGENKSFIQKIKTNFIGDREFYKVVIALLVPIIIQQGLTSVVNLLDNVMVGRLSTAAISGVGIVNQLVFVFNLTIFGSLSGASIYSAQYAGVKDDEGVRNCFRFKIIIGTVVTAAALLIFSFFGDKLIALYLNESTNSPEMLAETMKQAKDYIFFVLLGLPPFMLSQCYGSSIRETGDTAVPMRASVISIITNFVLNYILIYGKLGLPAMGVRGAAIATTIARYTEIVYLAAYVYSHKEKYPFIKGALKSLKIPGKLVKKIAVTGLPLLCNELLWSVCTASVNQCFSVRGLDVVAAVNITGTAWQVFAVIMFAIGSAIAIMLGQQLGNNDIEGARLTDNRLLFASFTLHIGIGAIVVALSNIIPLMYNVEPAVREMTGGMLRAAGVTLCINALAHGCYFTIRSGGRTIITFLLDSTFTMVVDLPLAFVLCNFTSLDVVMVYFCVRMTALLKFMISLPMLIKGTWARNVIN